MREGSRKVVKAVFVTRSVLSAAQVLDDNCSWLSTHRAAFMQVYDLLSAILNVNASLAPDDLWF